MARGHNPIRLTASKRTKKRRASRPNDWLLYLRPIVLEVPIALEILTRLRWAHALQQRGIAVAPSPARAYRPKFALSEPLPQDTVFRDGDARAKVLAALKSPEEIAATLSGAELQRQLDVWECEVTMWGVAIWQKLGEHLRLRDQRADIVDFIRGEMSPGISEAKAAVLYDRLTSEPNAMHNTEFGSVMRMYVPTDEFGNEAGEMSPQDLEDLASPGRDVRELRRLYRGEHKKSLGGVRDVSPGLLRPADEPSSTERDGTNDTGFVSSASARGSGNVAAVSTGQLVLRRADNGNQIQDPEITKRHRKT